MRLNRIGEKELDVLLDVVLDAKKVKQYLAEIKAARDEANKVIDEANAGQKALEDRALEIETYDRTFDARRAEIKQAMADLEQAHQSIASQHKQLDARKASLDAEAARVAAKEKAADAALAQAAKAEKRVANLRTLVEGAQP